MDLPGCRFTGVFMKRDGMRIELIAFSEPPPERTSRPRRSNEIGHSHLSFYARTSLAPRSSSLRKTPSGSPAPSYESTAVSSFSERQSNVCWARLRRAQHAPSARRARAIQAEPPASAGGDGGPGASEARCPRSGRALDGPPESTKSRRDLLHPPVDGALTDALPLELEDLHGEARIGAEHVQLAVQDEDAVAVLEHGVDLEAQPR